jgi:GMP reductase
MRIKDGVKLDFCDVLIRPKRSDASSRSDVNLCKTYKTKHCGNLLECVPIIAANMDTTGTVEMAKALELQGACCALHKFYSNNVLEDFFTRMESQLTFYTLGPRTDDLTKLRQLLAAKVNIPLICLDAANGYTRCFLDCVKAIRDLHPGCTLMAGNVATPEIVQELLIQGVDIVKVGLGPGSACETRIVTGVGYPQLSAIIECADAAHGLGGLICADGGCRTTADIAKAFGAGADFVMLGGMLAGTNECAGERTDQGLKFYGMSSKEAQDLYYGGVKDYAAPEGRCSYIPLKGPVEDTIITILGALRSTCSYVGANTLKDLPKCTTFIRVNRVQ